MIGQSCCIKGALATAAPSFVEIVAACSLSLSFVSYLLPNIRFFDRENGAGKTTGTIVSF